MFVRVALTLLAITAAVAQLEYPIPGDLPNYIKKSLREKAKYKPLARASKRTISNLTLTEVIDKISEITKALNEHAKKNGYFVDYKLRLTDSNRKN